MKIQGPYLFDLTTKAIPTSNYLSKRTWSQFVPEDIEVEKTKSSILDIKKYVLSDSKQKLKTNFYESKIINEAKTNQDELIEANSAYLKKLAKPKIDRLKLNLDKQVKELENKKADVNRNIKKLKMKNVKKTASRAIKKIFSNKKLLDKTAEMKYWERREKQLRKEAERLTKRINVKKQKFQKDVKKINDAIFEKARTQIKAKIFRPSNKDLKIKATILLIPKRASKV